MQREMAENHMVMEKMEESSTALNSPTNQKIRTLATLLVLGSIEGKEEPKTRKKNKKWKIKQKLNKGNKQLKVSNRCVTLLILVDN